MIESCIVSALSFLTLFDWLVDRLQPSMHNSFCGRDSNTPGKILVAHLDILFIA